MGTVFIICNILTLKSGCAFNGIEVVLLSMLLVIV